jgi:hypothetical protein
MAQHNTAVHLLEKSVTNMQDWTLQGERDYLNAITWGPIILTS